MLSEKAKGKQRAREPPQGTIPGSIGGTAGAKPLVIRFTEGIPDLTLDVHPKETVKDAKNNIRRSRSQLKTRRIRLIHLGKLLTDSTSLYTLLESLEQRHIQGLTTDGDVSPDVVPSTTWLHCSVGPQLNEGEEDDTKVQTAQLKPLRGFDRLAAAGFSEQDIANFRMQFHAHSAGDYLDQDFTSEEELDEHARVLEEQWIDSMDSTGTASLSSSTSPSILHGIVLGFFFPLLPLFFFHLSKPAVFWDDGSEHDTMGTMVFSRRMQMGIVVGLAMNFLFGMWTYLLASA